MTMIVMIAGGGGLMFKSLQDYQDKEHFSRWNELDDSAKRLNPSKEEPAQFKSKATKG